jgi:hypothetical protein
MSRREFRISHKHAGKQLTLFPTPSAFSWFDRKFLADCGIATDEPADRSEKEKLNALILAILAEPPEDWRK